MVKDEDIIFITPAIHTKWLGYQKKIIKDLFPGSKHLIIDGRSNWPYAWFYWMKEIKDIPVKWFVHIDEDFFIEDKD
jgi:hypothetical protein